MNNVFINPYQKYQLLKKTIRRKNRRMVVRNRWEIQEKRNRRNGTKWRGYLHNHQKSKISNQYFATQKERAKKLLQPNNENLK